MRRMMHGHLHQGIKNNRLDRIFVYQLLILLRRLHHDLGCHLHRIDSRELVY